MHLSERIVHEHLPEARQPPGEGLARRLLSLPEAEVLREEDRAGSRPPDGNGSAPGEGIRHKPHRPPEEAGQTRCKGRQGLALVRMVREEDANVPPPDERPDGRERPNEVEVVPYPPARDRYVEINPDDDASAARHRSRGEVAGRHFSIVTGFWYHVIVEILASGRRNIVVLGAGFGGITALLKLYRGLKRRGLLADYHLALVNRNASHLYTPALYEIAAIPKDEAAAIRLKPAICIPIPDIIGRLPGVRFIGETVARLDPERHLISFASGNQMSFEYLVVALGAETSFFGIPGMAEHAIPLKTFGDAVRLRNRIEELVLSAAGTLRIVVGGGGPTGVELSAELVNFLCYLKERRIAEKCQEEITLIEASPDILPGFSREVISRARRRLTALGVKIITEERIGEVRSGEVWIGAARLPAHLVVWTGGVQPVRALAQFGLRLDQRGGIVVNEFLEARPRIYAIGDNASFVHPKTGRPLPGNIPVAEAGARIAAQNIIAGMTGGKRRPFRPLANYPFILAVGRKYAVTDLVIVKFFGFLGWIAKQLVELRYLLSILPWSKAIRTWFRTVYYSTTND